MLPWYFGRNYDTKKTFRYKLTFTSFLYKYYTRKKVVKLYYIFLQNSRQCENNVRKYEFAVFQGHKNLVKPRLGYVNPKDK